MIARITCSNAATSRLVNRRNRQNELEQRPSLAIRRRRKLATMTLDNPSAYGQS
jgi:hypothetical protein